MKRRNHVGNRRLLSVKRHGALELHLRTWHENTHEDVFLDDINFASALFDFINALLNANLNDALAFQKTSATEWMSQIGT